MKKNGKSETYLAYLKSYLIVLIVPLLITIFGYVYSNKMIEEEVLGYQTSILKRTQGIGDQVFNNHMLCKGALSSDKKLKNLMENNEWTGALMYDVSGLKDNLSSLVNSNNLMSDAQVYFPQSDNLITTKRRYSTGYSYIYSEEVGIEGDFPSIINFKKGDGYYVLHPGTEDTMVYFYQNYFANNYKDVLASVITVLKWKDIKDLIADSNEMDHGIVFLINKNNEIIGDNELINDSHFSYDYFTTPGILTNVKLGGKDYICSFTRSDILDFKYVMCVPRSDYYKKNSYLLYVIIAELIMCIAIGTSLAIYFAKKTSSPIEKLLIRMNANRLDYKEKSKGAEIFASLENAMTSVLAGFENMETQLKEHNELINDRMLVSLLNDRRHDDKMVKNYKESLEVLLNENLQGAGYRTIVIGFTDFEDSIFIDEGDENVESNLNLAYFSIKNIFGESLIGDGWGLTAESDNAVVIIIKDNDKLDEQLKTCIEFFKIYFNLKVFAAISKLHTTVDEIPASYEEAVDTANFITFWDGEVDSIIRYENNTGSTDSLSAGKYAEHIKKISNCISSRDYKGARDILEMVMDESFRMDISYMKMNQCQASGIISLVLSMFDDMKSDDSTNLYEVLDLPDRLLQTKSISQLRSEINVVFDEIILEYEQQSDGEAPKVIDEIKKYVDENFADPNLSISAVADEFKLSLTYVGRIFKKYTGTGVLEYLHTVRIESCKELLDKGDSVKDAAEKSGFLDSKAMIRTFRKFEGITPGQYKKRKV